jgi:hypothetical protein
MRRGVLPLRAARRENWEEKINILRKKIIFCSQQFLNY